LPFSNIMLPIDVKHAEQHEKVLLIACDLSRQYNAPITVVALPTSPTGIARQDPSLLSDALAGYAAEQMARHGVSMRAKAVPEGSFEPDFGQALGSQISSTGADLVLIAANGDDSATAKAVQLLLLQTSASVFFVR